MGKWKKGIIFIVVAAVIGFVMYMAGKWFGLVKSEESGDK